MDESTHYFTTAEAAELLDKSPLTLRDQVTAGKVPHRRIHGGTRGVRFTQEDLAAIREADRVPAGKRFPLRAATGAPDEPPTTEDHIADPWAAFSGLRSLRSP